MNKAKKADKLSNKNIPKIKAIVNSNICVKYKEKIKSLSLMSLIRLKYFFSYRPTHLFLIECISFLYRLGKNNFNYSLK